MRREGSITFPQYAGVRCLMMPYIQGDPASVPSAYVAYSSIIRTTYIRCGDVGYLTIDESPVTAGKPHRGTRATTERALHTEVGRIPGKIYCWGSGGGGSWGGKRRVTLDRGVEILLANNVDDSCAIWNAEHEDTSLDGDIGYAADSYPYDDAVLLKAGDVYRIGIFTPHESLCVSQAVNRQFLRIVGAGVYGREPYFTRNPLLGTYAEAA